MVEKLEALLKEYPQYVSGGHDKELIAKYLEVYHQHIIPDHVLAQMPSFETIRRARQKFTAEQQEYFGRA